MSGKGLWFKRVDVKRMPGCCGFSLKNLASGVNVIHGPNASGKSTTARAIRSLLWPELAPSGSEINATFEYDGSQWDAMRDGRRTIYRMDATEASSPISTEPSRSGAYFLDLFDLLGGDNKDFAEEIRRELIGGYDIDAVASKLDYKANPTQPIKLKSALEDSEKVVAAAADLQAKLQEDEGRLDQLKRELTEAEAAQSQVTVLEKALEHARAREEHGKAESALECFDIRIGKFIGNELETLDGLDKRRTVSRDQKASAKRALDEARANALSCGFAAGQTPEDVAEVIRGLSGNWQNLQDIEKRRDDAARELDAAQGRCDTARQNINQITGCEAGDDELASVTISENWTQLREFARESEILQGKLQALGQLKNWFADRETGDAKADAEPLDQQMSQLQEWLEAGSESDGKSLLHQGWFRWAAGLALIATGAAVFLANLPLLLIVPIIIGIILVASPGKAAVSRRHDVQKRYASRWDDGPSDWTTESVAEFVRGLRRQWGQLDLTNQEVERAREIRQADNNIQQRRSELQQTRVQLAERLGVVPEIDEAALCLLADGIRQWQSENVLLHGCREAFGKQEAKCNGMLSIINDTLSDLGYKPSPNAATARANIDDLNSRLDQYRAALAAKRKAVEDLIDARSAIRNAEKERRDLFNRLGFETDDEHTLRASFGKLTDYRQATSHLEKCTGALTNTGRLIEDNPDLMELAESEIENRLHDYQHVADGRDGIHTQIVEIRTKINGAKQGHGLEEALARRELSREELRGKREEAYHSAAGFVLTDFLKKGSQTEIVPVFTEAKRKFAEFTYHQFTLEFDNNDKVPAFAARETSTNDIRGLGELSSGTRVQLLLAVRMAFAERQEQGIKLPIMLDETLATSDDERARKIIEAVIEICRDGRQVFYFTAQTDEVRKWKHLLDEHSRVSGDDRIEFVCSDLVEIRNLEAESIPFPEFESGVCEVPDPDGMTHQDYGQLLEVPRYDVGSEYVGAAHIWYVIEDTRLIHALLKNERIITWGQLQSACETRRHKPLDNAQFALARSSARVLEEVGRCWKIGRGRTLNSQAIDDSGAVSDRYRASVLQKLQECDNDATRLLELVKDLRGFRNDKLALLTDYLREEGYLDERDELTEDEITSRVMDEMYEDIQAGIITAENVRRILDISLAER